MERINLYGAGGHAKVILDIVEAQGNEVGVVYDDNPQSDIINGKKIVKPHGLLSTPIIISIGSNIIRKKIAQNNDLDYATAIHPSAIISPYSKIGAGTVIMQGSIVQSDVVIGNHCIINSGSSIDHECVIGDYVHISPHATLCGNVKIGEGSWIGAGTTIIPGIKIGEWCVIGAGSTVIFDVPDNTVVVGSPAKEIKRNFIDFPSGQ